MIDKCPSCGEKIEGHKKYCIHCGAELTANVATIADGYEFTSEQDAVLKQLAKYMSFVGWLMIFAGPMCMIAGVIGWSTGGAEAFGSIIQGLIFFFIGLWTKRASRSFRMVATTAGNDIVHLMDAIGELRKLYKLQYVLLLTFFVLFGLVFLLALAGIAINQ